MPSDWKGMFFTFVRILQSLDDRLRLWRDATGKAVIIQRENDRERPQAGSWLASLVPGERRSTRLLLGQSCLESAGKSHQSHPSGAGF